METLTSRENELIRHVRLLGADRAARQTAGEFVCDGTKLLREALLHGTEITAALWASPPTADIPCARQYLVPPELLDYVSPLKSAADVVFTVKRRHWALAPPGRALVLETIQDPGNLGTILRTANALGMDSVVLTGACADPYSPKAVRATMGAVFRQRFYVMECTALRAYLTEHGVRLYGAALSPAATDIRSMDLRGAAVAIGSEGQGLSAELRALCDGELIIPMRGGCESLNAAVAAAIVMWELGRQERGNEKSEI
ncbi:MAG: RNA methyltransferase [Oscillospiraceae bacterium]|nr:RNA methyltransferase [Oscillospiraceae bacterium]